MGDSGDRKGSFAVLHDSLLNPTQTATDTLQESLSAILPVLQSCGTPFKRIQKDSAESFKKKKLDISDNEREIVNKLSDIFDVDHEEMNQVVNTYKYEKVNVSMPDHHTLEISDFMDSFASFYFNERLVLLSIVKVLFSASTDHDSPVQSVAKSLTSSIISSTTATKDSNAFFSRLLQAFVDRSQEQLPIHVRSQPRLYDFFTKQLLREQAAMVNLLLVSFYSDIIQPPTERFKLAYSVLSTIKNTEWGEKQPYANISDNETSSLIFRIQNLLVILSIEVLSIDYPPNYDISAFTASSPPAPLPSEPHITHPKTFDNLHTLIISISSAHPNLSKPLVIAWSYILKKFTDSILDSPMIAPEYLDLAKKLCKLSAGSDWKTTLDSSQDDPPLRTKLVGRTIWQEALLNCLQGSHSIFTALTSLCNSSILSQTSSDTLIYLSSIRLVFCILCRIVHPTHYLPPVFDSLVNVFSLLYSRPDANALRLEFFPNEHASTQIPDFRLGQQYFLNTAISRFPLQSEVTLCILATLNSSPSSSERYMDPTFSDDAYEVQEIADMSSRIAHALDSLPELTHLTQSTLTLETNSGELVSVVDIPITKSIRIPKGTYGTLLASPEQGATKMVIQWNLCKRDNPDIFAEQEMYDDSNIGWSAWMFFADVFEEVSNSGRQSFHGKKQLPSVESSDDVFSAPSTVFSKVTYSWQSENHRDVTLAYAFNLLRTCLSHDVATASFVIDRMSSGRTTAEDVIRNLFRVFEKAVLERPLAYKMYAQYDDDRDAAAIVPSRLIVENGLHIFAYLVPTYTGAVWTLLRSFPSLFNSRSFSGGLASADTTDVHPILVVDKLEGTYDSLLSLLNLIQQLLYEARRSATLDPPELKNIKNSVLTDALTWVLQDVWSAFEGWKYNWIGQRYEIGRRCCEIINTVVEEFTRQHCYRNYLSSVSKASKSSKASESTSLDGVLNLISNAFLSERAPISLSAPIISLITTSGFNSFESLLVEGRENVFSAAELTVGSALRLTNTLLTCKRSLNTFGAHSISPLVLERLLFSQPQASVNQNDRFYSVVNNADNEPILTLTTAILDQNIEKNLAVSTLYVLVQLSNSSRNLDSVMSTTQHHIRSSSTPVFSLITYLGGPRQIQELLSQLVADLSDTGGPLRSSEWKVAVWDLLTSWVENQPSLTLEFVRGVKVSDESKGSPKITQVEKTTVLQVASKHLNGNSKQLGGEDASLDELLLTESVVRFLHFLWQHLAEYSVELKAVRNDSKFWADLYEMCGSIEVNVEEAESGNNIDEVPIICAKIMILYHVLHVIALDMQFEKPSDNGSTQTPLSSTEQPESTNQFQLFLKFHDKFLKLHNIALKNSCDGNLQSNVRSWLRESFKDFDLESIRRAPFGQPYDGSRKYGVDYLYPSEIAGEFLDGCLDTPRAENSGLVEAGINAIGLLNLNWSLADVQISLTRAWAVLIQAALPKLSTSPDKSVTKLLSDCISKVLDTCSEPLLSSKDQSIGNITFGNASLDKSLFRELETEGVVDTGDLAASIQHARFTTLAPLTELRAQLRVLMSSEERKVVVEDIQKFAMIARSVDLGPLSSLRDRKRAPSHRPFFKALFFTLATFEETGSVPNASTSGNLSTQGGFGYLRAMELIVRYSTLFLRNVLSASLIPETADKDTENDMSLLVSVYQKLLFLAMKDPSLVPYWLTICRELDIFQQIFEVLVKINVVDGRPIFAQHVVCLCLGLAAFPQAAEAMALEGIMAVLSNNALTPMAQEGTLSPLVPFDSMSSTGPQRDRESIHMVFCSMIALVTRLVESLGTSNLFMDQVLALVRLYDVQLSSTFNINVDRGERLHFGVFDEMHAVLGLYNVVIKRLSLRGASAAYSNEDITMSYVTRSLNLLQQIVYLLSHPNHLISLLEPIGLGERMWLDLELDSDVTPIASGTGSSSEGENIVDRPVVACLTQELLIIAGMIVTGLQYALSAFDPFRKDVVDWPLNMAAIYPTSKVMMGEPATIGTLWELSSICLDVIQQVQSTTQSKDPKRKGSDLLHPPIPLQPFSIEKTVKSATFTLETTLVLATSQMGYWLYRGPPSVMSDANMASEIQREIQGDLSTDLLDIIRKAPGGSGGGPSTLRSSLGGGAEKQAGELTSKLYIALKVFVDEYLKTS